MKTAMVIVALAVVLATMVGAQVNPTVSVLAPTAPVFKDLKELTHGKKHGHTGVSATFSLDGEEVHIEARRGHHIQGRHHDGGPRYEVDVCILDGAGRPLIAQYGGDEPVIPECASDDGPVDIDAHPAVQAFGMPDDRTASFKRAEKAVKLIRKAGFRKKFKPEFDAIVGQLELLSEGRRGEKKIRPETMTSADLPNPEAAENGSNVPEPQNHPTGFTHVIEVHSDYVRGTRSHATHGATIAYRIPHLRKIQFAWSNCNHGRCYWAMPWLCAYQSPANRVYHVHMVTCATYYNPFSFLGGHNCNDDTRIELQSIIHNVHFDRFGGTCSDSFRNDFTPLCNG